MIAWTLILSTLLVYHHYSLVTCGGLELLIDNDSFKLYFMISLYPVDTVLTFSTASSLLYLFYFQARRRDRAEHVMEKPGGGSNDSTLYYKEGNHEWKRLLNNPKERRMTTLESNGVTSNGIPIIQS